MNWLSFGKRNRVDLASQTTASADNPSAADSLEKIHLQPAASCLKKILIVDDDAVIIKTTSAKLKSNGYQVITAMDAAEAVSAVRQNRPDLILLDISFPPDVAHGGSVDWDGLKIMAWLQRIDEAKNIPVIIISGGDPEK